jgi:hypothetical protein
MLSAVVSKARSELHQEDSFLGQLQKSLECRIKCSNADKANNLLSDEDKPVPAEGTKTEHQLLLAAASRSESQLSGKTDNKLETYLNDPIVDKQLQRSPGH